MLSYPDTNSNNFEAYLFILILCFETANRRFFSLHISQFYYIIAKLDSAETCKGDLRINVCDRLMASCCLFLNKR